MRPILLLPVLALSAFSKELPVADASAFQATAKQAQPGDTLVLASGDWSDTQLVFTGKGTASAPITLRAATPGKTVFTGKSTLKVAGEFLVIEGLLFKDPDPTISDVISFREESDSLASHCRMTQCAMISSQTAAAGKESRWLGLYGAENRVDHCVFQGKSGKGTTFVVWLGDGNEGKHQIDHNYFGSRERLGKNGGETIRIGDSKSSMLKGACVVEHNLFEKCNGEAECISNKSCGNLYRDNTFLEVGGTLTLRHGNGCTVERNVFIGHGASGTGGIRLIGEDHIVRDNYLENLTGDTMRSAICFMMGIPNSPANRYFQVKNARVENNSIVGCEHSMLIGLSEDKLATLAPVGTVIRGNQILSPKHEIIEARCALDGITWENNCFSGKSLGIPATAGIATDAPKIMALKPILRTEVGTVW
jgi:poly(beta-D-mannuronate) lyase